MWILNQVVIDLYSRVWELLYKLLWKQRFPVYTSCVGNRLPRVLPRVPALNEPSRRLLSETFDLLPVSHESSIHYLLFCLYVPSLSASKTNTCLLSIKLLLTSLPISFYSCVPLCSNLTAFYALVPCLLFFIASHTRAQRSKTEVSIWCFALFGVNNRRKPLFLPPSFTVFTNLIFQSSSLGSGVFFRPSPAEDQRSHSLISDSLSSSWLE